MRFESATDLAREKKAIEVFVSLFGGRYTKLDPNDVDYKVFDRDGNLIAYVEVKGRIRTLRDAFPLPISVKKIIKLVEKRLNPVVIWACEDGVIYAKVRDIRGDIMWGGRTPREGASNDEEMMAYYDKQDNFRYIRYT